MAQGQAGNSVAPDTLPGDFFDKQDPLKTGEGMVTPKAPAPSLPEPQPGIASALGKTTGLTSGTDPGSELASQAVQIGEHPVSEFVRGAKGLGMAPVNLAYNAVHHPIDTATDITGGPEFATGLENRNVSQMAGAIGGGMLNTLPGAYGLREPAANLASAGADVAGDALTGAKDTLGRMARVKETGKLKPGVRTVARVGGAGVGGIVGGGPGAMAGTLIGPSLADTLLPEHPNPDAWAGKIPVTMPKRTTPFEVGSPTQEGGYYPPVTRVPIRPEPSYKLTPESVPGPDTAGKGNLLSPLAKAGDPRAAAELARRGRKVLYVPAEEYPEPRSKTSF